MENDVELNGRGPSNFIELAWLGTKQHGLWAVASVAMIGAMLFYANQHVSAIQKDSKESSQFIQTKLLDVVGDTKVSIDRGNDLILGATRVLDGVADQGERITEALIENAETNRQVCKAVDELVEVTKELKVE